MGKELKAIPETEFNGILQKYKNSLVVYGKKPIRQFFLCPIGLVGAGKTTVLKPLAEQLQAIRVSNDEIRVRLREKGYNFDLAQKISIEIIEDFARRGYSLAIDADCVNKKIEIDKIASEVGAKIIWLHINPPEKFILNKLKKLKIKEEGLFKSRAAGIKNYFDRKPLHQKLDFSFLYEFDTSKNNLKSQINEAIKLIRLELKKYEK